MKALIGKIRDDQDIEIIELEIPPDHIHMVVRVKKVASNWGYFEIFYYSAYQRKLSFKKGANVIAKTIYR